jgi:hypothetical protein
MMTSASDTVDDLIALVIESEQAKDAGRKSFLQAEVRRIKSFIVEMVENHFWDDDANVEGFRLALEKISRLEPRTAKVAPKIALKVLGSLEARR